jgi:hypothetical protein
MKKKIVLLIVCCASVSSKQLHPQEREKLSFGIISGVTFDGYSRPDRSSNATMGVFLNYAMSQRLAISFDLEKKSLFGFEVNRSSEQASLLNKFLLRDWSASLAFNYYFKPLSKKLLPYVGVGAGEYYILDSKAKIKRTREHPEEESLDYDMREHFKHPGFFGAAGLQFQPTRHTCFFIQSKCSVVFDQNENLMMPSSKFTDFFNITTGVRFILN